MDIFLDAIMFKVLMLVRGLQVFSALCIDQANEGQGSFEIILEQFSLAE